MAVGSLKVPGGKQQIRHKKSNGPYGYQCKNRGFVLGLSKRYKTNKISTFPALFLMSLSSIVIFPLVFNYMQQPNNTQPPD